MNSVKKFNKVIGIIAFILMITSFLLTVVINQANVYAESLNTHVHTEACAHESVAVGENESAVLSSDPTTDPAECPHCHCTVYGCSKCWTDRVVTNGKPTDTQNIKDGVVTYTNICPGKDQPGYVCPLDITKQSWYTSMMQIVDVIDGFLLPIILILGTAGTIFVIVLGVQFSKAESADKREEAKKRMINAIIGVVVTLLLLILVKLFTANAPEIVGWINRQ